jgi:glutathione S-transferase
MHCFSRYLAYSNSLNHWGKRWDDLYPKELSARARVDEYLHWHHGGIRTLAKAYMSPRVRLDKKQPDPEGIKELEKAAHRAVSLVESGFLGRGDGSQFVAGTAAPTVADFLCYSEVASLGPKYGQVLDLSPEEFPRVNRYAAVVF